MATLISWQLGSSDPDNEPNLIQIAQWWAQLSNEKVLWQQRPIPASGRLEEIDWKTQSFDQQLILLETSLRGITLYWRQETIKEERNITANELLLDLTKQQLDIIPSSSRTYTLRVTLPKIIYQTIRMDAPQVGAVRQTNGGLVLLCRDDAKRLEVEIHLAAAQVADIVAKA
ncbi:MAG: hypothetical protein HC919_09125 [Oscillatoriales cyanobacterium SM2_2_1]|nr:hypothetical protein [Oscillatoriales cyanobacterium SM2_2_1]